MSQIKQEFRVFVTMKDDKPAMTPGELCQTIYRSPHVDGVSVGQIHTTSYNDWSRQGIHGRSQASVNAFVCPPKDEEVKQSRQSFLAYHPALRLGCFFCAENIHHAGNKALKQWGNDIVVYLDREYVKDCQATVHQTKFTRILKAYYFDE